MPPLSIGFSMIATASLAYSSGLPIHAGKAASLVDAVLNSSGTPFTMPVSNRLGAMALTRMPNDPRVAGHRQRHPGDTGLGGRVGDLTDLSLEGGDRCGVDDHATLSVLVGFVPGHRRRLETVEIERRHEIEVDHRAELIEAVRLAVLVERLLADPAAGDVHPDVEATEGLDHLGDGLFGAVEIGDVTFEEQPVERYRHVRALSARSVEDRHSPAATAIRSAVALAIPDAPPTTSTRAPAISIQALPATPAASVSSSDGRRHYRGCTMATSSVSGSENATLTRYPRMALSSATRNEAPTFSVSGRATTSSGQIAWSTNSHISADVIGCARRRCGRRSSSPTGG